MAKELMKPLKIILVDDNEAFRKALKMLLTYEYNAEIIGEASNADEFWDIKDCYSADIILMDVMMPDVDGITLTKKILWERNNMKVIAITMHYEEVYLTTLLEAGFKGCIFKNNLVNDLGPALESVNLGNIFFPDKIMFK